jgi:hypothetical protein
MWFTENPWPPIVILVVAAIGCVWMWQDRRNSWWLTGAIACIALSGGVLVFERSTLTPREQIEQHILDMARAFQDRDEQKVLDFVSVQAGEVRSQVRLGFATVEEVENLRITDTSVTMLAPGSRAKLHFRANGTIRLRVFGDIGHHPTRWLMTWQQEGGQWKAIDIQRLNPITGEPIGLLDADS